MRIHQQAWLLRKEGGLKAKEEGNQDLNLNLNPHLPIKTMMVMDATFARNQDT